MLKIDDYKRWNSTGTEFVELLEKEGIDFKVVFEGLKVFELASFGVAGGKRFNVIEYIRPSDGQRVLVANGGFGVGDVVMEEYYLMELNKEQNYTSETIIEVIRGFINQEEDDRDREDKERANLNWTYHKIIRKVEASFENYVYKKDFEIPDKYSEIETILVEEVKKRLNENGWYPKEVLAIYLKREKHISVIKEDTIMIEIKDTIVKQRTTFHLSFQYELEGENIKIK